MAEVGRRSETWCSGGFDRGSAECRRYFLAEGDPLSLLCLPSATALALAAYSVSMSNCLAFTSIISDSPFDSSSSGMLLNFETS
jgi:hypothetical protein